MIRKITFISQRVALAGLLVLLMSVAHAEDSLIIDLSEELAKQAKVFKEKQRSLQSITRKESRARRLLSEVRKAPAGSQDHSFAVAEYVQARLATLGPKFALVNELVEVNGHISSNMGRLADAFDKKAKQQGIGEDVPKEQLLRTVTHIEGTNAILSILSQDPAVQGSPELRALFTTFKLQEAELGNSINTYNGDFADKLYRLRNLTDTHDALLRSIRSRLGSELDRLKLAHSQSVSSTVALKIQSVLDGMYGAFNQNMGDGWFEADMEVIQSTERGVFDMDVAATEYTTSRSVTDSLREKYGLPPK